MLTNACVQEPTFAVEALLDENWMKAMVEEYNAVINNKTWTLVELPSVKRLVGCKWIFKVKRNLDGTISRYKACMFAKGFLQKSGFNFTETFSPVIKPTTIIVILTLALSLGWITRQLNVNNAFLNGELKEAVYIWNNLLVLGRRILSILFVDFISLCIG